MTVHPSRTLELCDSKDCNPSPSPISESITEPIPNNLIDAEVLKAQETIQICETFEEALAVCEVLEKFPIDVKHRVWLGLSSEQRSRFFSLKDELANVQPLPLRQMALTSLAGTSKCKATGNSKVPPQWITIRNSVRR
ncbi:hypothetical protein [Trichocoleus sp. DQ-U1]|uniref:hypothetical protein n=1 Tax=Trichocoleus sp. DQ-U1 TaxID=2933926 RepID=UPI00329A67FA